MVYLLPLLIPDSIEDDVVVMVVEWCGVVIPGHSKNCIYEIM